MPIEHLNRRDLVQLLAGTAVVAGSSRGTADAKAVADAKEARESPSTGGPAASLRNKITLEEHFAFPGAASTMFHPPGLDGSAWQHINEKLQDVEGHRLPEMDANGVAMQVVSLTANGVQGEPDKRQAVDYAKAANDWVVDKFTGPHPKRFGGFASAALQDPDAAVRETERAIKQLGLSGVLVNGFTNIGDENTGEYLDLPKFLPFWQCCESLDVPVYLHPRVPLASQRLVYAGHDELLGAMWAFAAETSAHALRLMTSGLFDRCPKLQIILGHGGEGLVAMMARAQRRFEYTPCGKHVEKPLAQYLRDNFYITTSGNFHTPTLNNCIEEIGIDRVMFSVDYPYENMAEGAKWFDSCPLQGLAREKVARLNAKRLLKLTAV